MGIQKDKLTEEQKQEIERLRNFVARNRLNAQMNGTKWRAAIDAVMAIPGYAPSFRVKCIPGGAEPAEGAWDPAFPANIPLYNSIEWLELNPRLPGPDRQGAAGGAGYGSYKKDKGQEKGPDFREALKRELISVKIPILDTPTGVRIIGYSRSGGK
jgi:hypothetical protein